MRAEMPHARKKERLCPIVGSECASEREAKYVHSQLCRHSQLGQCFFDAHTHRPAGAAARYSKGVVKAVEPPHTLCLSVSGGTVHLCRLVASTFPHLTAEHRRVTQKHAASVPRAALLVSPRGGNNLVWILSWRHVIFQLWLRSCAAAPMGKRRKLRPRFGTSRSSTRRIRRRSRRRAALRRWLRCWAVAPTGKRSKLRPALCNLAYKHAQTRLRSNRRAASPQYFTRRGRG